MIVGKWSEWELDVGHSQLGNILEPSLQTYEPSNARGSYSAVFLSFSHNTCILRWKNPQHIVFDFDSLSSGWFASKHSPLVHCRWNSRHTLECIWFLHPCFGTERLLCARLCRSNRSYCYAWSCCALPRGIAWKLPVHMFSKCSYLSECRRR